MVKQIAVGNHCRGKIDILLPEALADDVDDTRIEQGLAAEPGELDFLTAAVVPDEPDCLFGGFGSHDWLGPAFFEAVKAPGVAVHGGENGIAGDILGLLLLVLQHPTDQVGVLPFLRPLRHGEPMLPEIVQRKQVPRFLFGQQNQLPGQEVVEKGVVLDGFLDDIMKEAGAGTGGEEFGEDF